MKKLIFTALAVGGALLALQWYRNRKSDPHAAINAEDAALRRVTERKSDLLSTVLVPLLDPTRSYNPAVSAPASPFYQPWGSSGVFGYPGPAQN